MPPAFVLSQDQTLHHIYSGLRQSSIIRAIQSPSPFLSLFLSLNYFQRTNIDPRLLRRSFASLQLCPNPHVSKTRSGSAFSFSFAKPLAHDGGDQVSNFQPCGQKPVLSFQSQCWKPANSVVCFEREKDFTVTSHTLSIIFFNYC